MKNLTLHIEQIKDKNLRQDFEENAEAFPTLADMVQNHECEFLEPLKISMKAFRVRELFEVQGALQTRIRLTCSRCLKDFDTALKSEFELTYTKELVSITETSTEEEIELRVEDIGLLYFRGEEINLRDGIQEQVVLAFPLRFLCAEACKGLCTHCGADLNQGDCGCKVEPSTNKFAALKDLKLNKNTN
jgi:uncharacterized protein